MAERNSAANDLGSMTTLQILHEINAGDKCVALAVEECIPQIAKIVERYSDRVGRGGRVFCVGWSGYSLKAPFVSIPAIVGNDSDAAWISMTESGVTPNDMVIGIDAGGSSPFVIGALRKARTRGLLTACITCSAGALSVEEADMSAVIMTGEEFAVKGAAIKAFTAMSLALNMIVMAVMIRTGQLHNEPSARFSEKRELLVERGTRAIMEETGSGDYELAKTLLLRYGSVRKAVEHYKH